MAAIMDIDENLDETYIKYEHAPDQGFVREKKKNLLNFFQSRSN